MGCRFFCSFHVYPFKDHFPKYQEFDSSWVTMGNNAMCKVVGIENM